MVGPAWTLSCGLQFCRMLITTNEVKHNCVKLTDLKAVHKEWREHIPEHEKNYVSPNQFMEHFDVAAKIQTNAARVSNFS